MFNYTFVLNQFTLYVGSFFLIAGVLGNLINIGVFYKNNLRNPSTLLLFLASCFNILFISVGLLSRICAAGLNIDVASNSLSWCRARFYLLQLWALSSVSCICYATIDQFFISSQHEKLRRLSNFSATVKVICILLLILILYSIPLLIYSDLVQLSDGRIACIFTTNIIFTRYASYFNLPIIWGITTITFLVIFGILTYRNISLIHNARSRERAQQHLASMILLHIIFIVIGTLPYASYYTYSAITLTITKSVDRLELETFLSNIVAVILYFSNSCSFFVYYLASTTYRRQVKNFFHILRRNTLVEPIRSLTLPRETRGIQWNFSQKIHGKHDK
jgi:hypothetical protein